MMFNKLDAIHSEQCCNCYGIASALCDNRYYCIDCLRQYLYVERQVYDYHYTSMYLPYGKIIPCGDYGSEREFLQQCATQKGNYIISWVD